MPRERSTTSLAAPGAITRPVPKVTIITPCRNSGRWLKPCIESVLAQTFADWEMIVVDDGSTDDSIAVIEPFLKDSRIKLFRRPPGVPPGPAAARNWGIRNSSGKWIAILDADDVWVPDRLEKSVHLLESRGDCDVCYSTAYDMQADGTVFRKRKLEYYSNDILVERLIDHNFVPSGTTTFSRRCFDEIGGFDETSLAEDHDFVLRAAMRFKFCAIDEPLIYFRYHDQNLSLDERVFQSRLRIMDKCEERRPDLKKIIRRGRSRIYYAHGIFCLVRGRMSEARENLVRSISIYPYSPWPYYLWLKTFIPQRRVIA